MPTQTIPVIELDKAGLIADSPSVNLPQNAFSDALNVRFKDGAVRKIKGHIEVLNNWDSDNRILHIGYWSNPNGATYVVVSTNGSNDTEALVWTVTPDEEGNASASQRALDSEGEVWAMEHSDAAHWQTVNFNGGYSIVINNGLQKPRHMTDTQGGISSDIRTQELPGWDNYTQDSETVTRVTAGNIIAVGGTLIAGNLTEYYDSDGNEKVLRDLRGVVRSSDVAEPGAIPANWDPNQTATNTADEISIADTGQITAMAQLQGNIYVYTADSINQLRLRSDGLAESPVTSNYGALGRDLVMEFDGSHLVVGSDDIYLFAGHPGNIQSVSDGRVRRLFYDDAHYFYVKEAQITRNQAYDEIWINYASNLSGAGRFDKALIWNYRNNTWTVRDLNDAVSMTVGPVPGGGSEESLAKVSGTEAFSATAQDEVAEVQQVSGFEGTTAQSRFKRPQTQTLVVDSDFATTAQITGERRVKQVRRIDVAADATVSDAHDRHESQELTVIADASMRSADNVPEIQTVSVNDGLSVDTITAGAIEQQQIQLSGTDANTVDSAAAQTAEFQFTFGNDQYGFFETGVSDGTNSLTSVSASANSNSNGCVFSYGVSRSKNYHWSMGMRNVTFTSPFNGNYRLQRYAINGPSNYTTHGVDLNLNLSGDRLAKLASRIDVDTHHCISSQSNRVFYTTNTGASWSSYTLSDSYFAHIIHTGSRWYLLKSNGTLWYSTQYMPTSSSHWIQISTSGLGTTTSQNSMRWLEHSRKLIVMSIDGWGYVHNNGNTFVAGGSSGGSRPCGADEDPENGVIYVICSNANIGYRCTNISNSTMSVSSFSTSGTTSTSGFMVVHKGRGNWSGIAFADGDNDPTGAYANWTSTSTSFSRTALAGSSSYDYNSQIGSMGYHTTEGRIVWVTPTLAAANRGILWTNNNQFPARCTYHMNSGGAVRQDGTNWASTSVQYNFSAGRSASQAASDFASHLNSMYGGNAGFNASASGSTVTVNTGQHVDLSGYVNFSPGSGWGTMSISETRTGRSKRNASTYSVRNPAGTQVQLLTATSQESKDSIGSKIASAVNNYASDNITWSASYDNSTDRVTATASGPTAISGNWSVSVTNAATTGDYAAAADGDITSTSSTITEGVDRVTDKYVASVLIPGNTPSDDITVTADIVGTVPSDPDTAAVNLTSAQVYSPIKNAILAASQTAWTIDTDDDNRRITFTAVDAARDIPSQAAITVTEDGVSGLSNASFVDTNNPRGVFSDGSIVLRDPNDSEHEITIGDGSTGLTYRGVEIMDFIHSYLDSDDNAVTNWTYDGQQNGELTTQYTRTPGSPDEYNNFADHFRVIEVKYGKNADDSELETGNTADTDSFVSNVTQGLDVPAQTLDIRLPGELITASIDLANPDAGNNNQLLNATSIAKVIKRELINFNSSIWENFDTDGGSVVYNRINFGEEAGSAAITAQARPDTDGSDITNVETSDFKDTEVTTGYDTDAPVMRIAIPTDNVTIDHTIANANESVTNGTLLTKKQFANQIITAISDHADVVSFTADTDADKNIFIRGVNDTEGHEETFSIRVQSNGSLNTVADPLNDDDFVRNVESHKDVYPLSISLTDPAEDSEHIIEIQSGNDTDGKLYNDSEITAIIHDGLGGEFNIELPGGWTVSRTDSDLIFTHSGGAVPDMEANAHWTFEVTKHSKDTENDSDGNGGSLETGNLTASTTTHGRDATRAATVTITPLERDSHTITLDSDTHAEVASKIAEYINDLEGYEATVENDTDVNITSQIFGEGTDSVDITHDAGTQYENLNNYRAVDVEPEEFNIAFTPGVGEVDPERPWPKDTLNEAQNYMVWNTDYNFYAGDLSYGFDGETFKSYVERKHFHMAPTKDVETIHSVGIHATTEDTDTEATLDVRITTSNNTQQAIDLTDTDDQYTFKFHQDYKVDTRKNGRMLNYRLENESDEEWNISGFDLEVGKRGER